jgi:hypothetical protein
MCVRRKSPKKSSKLNPYSRNAAENRIDCRIEDYNGGGRDGTQLKVSAWAFEACEEVLSNASLAAVRAPDLDPPKPRRGRAVSRAHHLLRLAFAAIRRTP